MNTKKIEKSKSDKLSKDRREFLKSIGKAILPSFAIMGLGISAVSCGCMNTCRGGCENTCVGDCEGYCSGTCGYTCYTGV